MNDLRWCCAVLSLLRPSPSVARRYLRTGNAGVQLQGRLPRLHVTGNPLLPLGGLELLRGLGGVRGIDLLGPPRASLAGVSDGALTDGVRDRVDLVGLRYVRGLATEVAPAVGAESDSDPQLRSTVGTVPHDVPSRSVPMRGGTI